MPKRAGVQVQYLTGCNYFSGRSVELSSLSSSHVTTEILLYLKTECSQKKMYSVRSNYSSPALCPGLVPRLRNVAVAFPFSGSASIKSEHVPQSQTQTHRGWAVTHIDADKLPSQHLCTQDAHRQRHRQTSPLLLFLGFFHPKITGTLRQQSRLEALLLSSWLRD